MRSVLLLFLVASVAAAQSAPPAPARTKPQPAGQSAKPAFDPNARYQSAPPRKDIPAIAKAANGAVVSIIMSDKDGSPIAQGTGFLISKDGLVMTNYHVIASGSSAVVKLPDGAFYAVDGVVASDKARDVAVIKAHGENFRTLALGNSDRLQVGEEVVAIGNPLSLESTVSNGIVSGIRTVQEEGGKFVQVTTPISPGSSGGPLFNMAGEVIGITTAGLRGGENLNFAIPINDAKRLLLDKSSIIWALPNETEPVKAQTHDGDAQARNQPIAGLYQSEEAKGTDNVFYWMYLRFYSDGTVIGASTSGTPDQIAKWFKKPFDDTGRYQVQGSTLRFSLVSPYGTVDYQGQIQGTGTVLSMDSFSQINGHRGHTTFHLVRPGDEDGGAPSSVSAPAAQTNPSARDYYQQLYNAGGFSSGLPNAVCFSDDAHSGTFFTFVAYAYDKDYYDAQAKLPTFEQARAAGFPNVTPEEMTQFKIMERVQRTAPYVTFLMKDWLESFPPEAQQFFRSGGRVLDETVYEKGVNVNTIEYRWDGSSWFISLPPADPNAYIRTSKILRLSIEPTTMRYVDSTTVTVTVGKGETAATDTSHYGPWPGVCEKVPNPK